jgi:hypothetical protein
MKLDKRGNDLDDDSRVFMVVQGLCMAWVCASRDLTKDQVQSAVDNQILMAGTSLGWQVCEDHTNADDNMRSPGLCADCTDTRQHWMLQC